MEPQRIAIFQIPFYDDKMLFMLDHPVPPKQRKGKVQRREFEEWFRGQFEHMRPKKVGWPFVPSMYSNHPDTWPEDGLERTTTLKAE